MRLSKISAIASLVFAASLALPASAQLVVTPITWTSTSTGTIGSVDVTATGFSGFFNTDLSGSDFSAGPLGSDQQTVSYSASSDWTVTLSSAQDLLVYVTFWRPEGTYTFNEPFDILSGLSGASEPSPGVFQYAPGYNNGILRFNGITTLTLTSTTGDSSSQAVTFGLAAVPEPSTYAAWLGSAVALAATASRLRRKRLAATPA